MTHRSNAGFGTAFLIVLVVLVVLSIIGLGTKYLTRGATRVSEAVFAGQDALTAGRSALEEAWVRLEGRVNQPDDELARWFASPPSATRKLPCRFTIAPTEARAACAQDGTVAIGDVSFLVPSEDRIFATNPLERMGLLRASVTVVAQRPGLRAAFSRTLVQWREYKALYPVPPYPFGESSLFVFIPFHLVGYEKRYRELQAQVDGSLREQEKELTKKNPTKKKVKLPRPFEGNADVYRYFPDYRYPPFPYNARSPKPANYDVAPPSDESDMDNALVCSDRELRAEHFKLRWPENLEHAGEDWIVQQLRRDAASADPRVVERTRAMLAGLNLPSAGDDQAGGRQALRNFETLLALSMKQYSQRFQFLPEASWQRFAARHLRFLINVGPSGTLGVNQSLRFNAQWRCTETFPDQASLWRRLRDPGGRVFLDGIYYVEGPIDVDMAYRGKGTIMGRDHIVVKRCVKERPGDPDSYCTLLSFCRTEPNQTTCASIELQADVEAGLVALPGMIKDLHLHDVSGSLAVGVVNPELVDGHGSPDPANDPLAGTPYPWTLTYDPALRLFDEATGKLRLDRCRVVLSPNLVGTSVER